MPPELIAILNQRKKIKNKLNLIDIFCGCGGISQGFYDAGFNPVLGIDNDEPSLKTFANHFGQDKTLKLDLFSDTFLRDIDEKLGENKKQIDVVVAGPPCQGFSLTGPRDFDDPRNKLYLSVFKIVKHYQPKAFLIENVKGMKGLYKGVILEEIVSRFKKLGYNVATPKILLAADYGVPQMRERLFIIGLQKEYGIFEFPEPVRSENNYISCSEAINNLPSRAKDIGLEIDEYSSKPLSEYQEFMQSNSKALYNHVATTHSELVKSVIKLVPEGKNYKSLPEGIGTSRKFNEAWTRYHSRKPSKTIDTGHRNHFHYKWDRVPTVRENARLQSFRDDFIFLGTKTQQNKQVGNAVPPLLAFYLAKQIMKFIK
jgi:DNA (cytosine-5)-methyltransferase 1